MFESHILAMSKMNNILITLRTMRLGMQMKGVPQGDQIGRIFAKWANVYCRQFSKITEVEETW
jgi:hypothetical protein